MSSFTQESKEEKTNEHRVSNLFTELIIVFGLFLECTLNECVEKTVNICKKLGKMFTNLRGNKSK